MTIPDEPSGMSSAAYKDGDIDVILTDVQEGGSESKMARIVTLPGTSSQTVTGSSGSSLLSQVIANAIILASTSVALQWSSTTVGGPYFTTGASSVSSVKLVKSPDQARSWK